jgi:predicted ABC-type transport system involved in lysophospholipase L1 biosynthesis ATPase subunit
MIDCAVGTSSEAFESPVKGTHATLATRFSKLRLVSGRELREERGMTVLVATHDENVGSRSDKVIRISDGRIS